MPANNYREMIVSGKQSFSVYKGIPYYHAVHCLPLAPGC